MRLNEKAAYIKGLKDGLKLTSETAEGRLIGEIVDFLADIAEAVSEAEDTALLLGNEIDKIYDEIYGDEFTGDETEDSEDDLFEIDCACGKTLYLDGKDLESGEIICQFCSEKVRLDDN